MLVKWEWKCWLIRGRGRGSVNVLRINQFGHYDLYTSSSSFSKSIQADDLWKDNRNSSHDL